MSINRHVPGEGADPRPERKSSSASNQKPTDVSAGNTHSSETNSANNSIENAETIPIPLDIDNKKRDYAPSEQGASPPERSNNVPSGAQLPRHEKHEGAVADKGEQSHSTKNTNGQSGQSQSVAEDVPTVTFKNTPGSSSTANGQQSESKQSKPASQQVSSAQSGSSDKSSGNTPPRRPVAANGAEQAEEIPPTQRIVPARPKRPQSADTPTPARPMPQAAQEVKPRQSADTPERAKQASEATREAQQRPPEHAREAVVKQILEATQEVQQRPSEQVSEAAKQASEATREVQQRPPEHAREAVVKQSPEATREAPRPEGTPGSAKQEPESVNGAEKKPVSPVHRPRVEHVVTPQQEEAANRLERKRRRPRRGTDITPVVKAGSGPAREQEPALAQTEAQTNHPSPVAALAAASELPTMPMPQSLIAAGSNGMQKEHDLLRWQRQRKIVLRHISRKHMRLTRLTKQRVVNRIWLAVFSVFLAIMAVVLTLTGASSYAAYRFYSDTQNEYTPQILNLRDLLPKDNLKIYDSKGVFLDQLTDDGVHTTVPLNQISKQIVNAEVSTEDKNFWTNPGIDVARIFQSALDDLRSGRVVAGGSTITQQLIKNLVVGNETSLQRKLQEVMLTPMINNRYSKSDIMEMYLNTVYYGEQAYGVDAAANIYYGMADQQNKPAASQLDLAQSAMLAGIVSSPTANDPLLHPQMAFSRFDFVISHMVTNGYITQAEAMNAAKEAHSAHFFKAPASTQNRAPHFVQVVLSQLEQAFHLTRQQLSRSDMSVYTTLDIGLQDKIQKIAQEHIAELAANNVTNAAEVLIDYHTGAVRSLLGSIDYNNKSIDGQFDVATSYRQPGSSFKPYVYVTAFEQGASPAQAINDSPLTIQLPGGDPPTFTPMNYDLRFHGAMTLRCALQNSLNVPAVKVLQHVGISSAMQTAYNMGVTSYQGTPGYSLVLGGLGVRLIDHTSAYGTFANGGVHVPYYTIQSVTFSATHQTYQHPVDPGTRVISPQLAYMMTSVLSDNTDRLPEFFDCNPLQLYSNSPTSCYEGDRGAVRPAAAKTGTTNDFKDNWTMGYTTDYVMGVWAGNDNDTPMYNVSGVQGAAPIWHDSMLVAEQGHPIQDFTNPGGLQRATVTYSDGVHTTDWFMPDTIPTSNLSEATPSATNNNGDNNNGGNGIISLNQNPLGKHPSKNNGNNNNGNNNGNNGDNKSGKGNGAPYCPDSFSYQGGGQGNAW